MMHNYEESEAELKAILEEEKWDTCYKELEIRWTEKNEDVIFLNEKSCYKLPEIKLPMGYYLFDLYENIENRTNEYEEEETCLKEDYEEMVFDFEPSGGFLNEELGDYDLMKYYCDSEEQGPTEPHNKYSEGCEWYNGNLYINTNKLGGYDENDYYAEEEDYDEPCLSEKELEAERVLVEYYQEDYKEEYPWEFYSLEVFWEEVHKVEEPWGYYPEVLETLWKEDYGDSSRNQHKHREFSFCDKIIYKYLGKRPDGELNHLLIYHCLDVAAVGHVFLQENDIYLSKMTLATGLDKKEYLSLITFYLTMHDLGKFSNGIQNGDSYSIHFHSKMGFQLWSQIWEKIWHDNLFGLDKNFGESKWKNLFEPWFKSVTNHHEKSDDPPQDFINKYSKEEDNIAAACCFVEKSAELFIDNNSETQKKYYRGMDVSFNSNSKLLNILTIISDQLGSEIKYFPYCSRIMDIKDYWEKYAMKQAKYAVEENGNNISKIFEELPIFSKQNKNADLIQDAGFYRNNALFLKEEYRYNEAIELYKKAINNFKKEHEKNPNSLTKKFLDEFELELMWLELNKDEPSEIKDDFFYTPDKKETSDKLTNGHKISKENIDKNYDRCLYEILRSLREELVISKGMPNTHFFNNKQLKDMATDYPQDMQKFLKIFGDGEKVKEYGESFLFEIVTYCKINNIEQKINSEHDYPPELQEIFNLYKKGLNLEEIYLLKNDLLERKIIRYLEQLILCGAEIQIEKFVNAKKQKKILEAISKVGDKSVANIKKKLNNFFITTGEIRIVRAYRIRNDK